MKAEVKNISKYFGDFHVLDDVSFNFESGKALGLLGRNGSGKTTTLRVIMNIFKANEGEVLIDGKPFASQSLTIGYLPEVRGLIENDKIKSQLIYLASLKGLKKKEASKQVDEYLEAFKLSEYKNKRLKTLSKGNQQKIQIVQALLGNPDIIVLDEPFSGLDPVNAKFLKNIIVKLLSENKLIIFSSHQMNYIEEFCSDIVIIEKGCVKLRGNLEEIKLQRGHNTYILKTDSTIADNQILNAVITRTSEDTYQINVDNMTLNELIQVLLKDKVVIKEIAPYKPSLFDIFIEEVGEIDEENA